MLLIAHRGNTEGRSDMENHPDHIDEALMKGFHVEVDVRCSAKGDIKLGHDVGQYVIPEKYWTEKRIWWHAKDLFSIEVLQQKGVHYFCHENDFVTITSEGVLWSQQPTKGGIWVYPTPPIGCRLTDLDIKGICDDNVLRWSLT